MRVSHYTGIVEPRAGISCNVAAGQRQVRAFLVSVFAMWEAHGRLMILSRAAEHALWVDGANEQRGST